MVSIAFNFGGKCVLNTLLTPPVLFSSFTQALSTDCFVDKFSVRLGLLCRLYLPSKGERIYSFHSFSLKLEHLHLNFYILFQEF